MREVNKQNIFNFLILVSLLHGIRGELSYIKEQRKITTGFQLENNFGKASGEAVITTAITEDDEKFDDYKLRKLFVEKYKFYENLEKKRNKNEIRHQLVLKRNVRDVTNNYSQAIFSCYTCSTDFDSTNKDEACYNGENIKTIEECPSLAQCFTELHPMYIKRGCYRSERQNRTFVCKCSLCNDKTSEDSTYYEYERLSEWEYDNHRLDKRVLDRDLFCKTCTARGFNKISDKICRYGKDADYVMCHTNQFCYTHIDIQSDIVSRGCINIPAYNSFYIYCNKTLCNNNQFKNPRTTGLFRYGYAEPLQTKTPIKMINNGHFNHKNEITLMLSICLLLKLCNGYE